MHSQKYKISTALDEVYPCEVVPFSKDKNDTKNFDASNVKCKIR